MKIAFIVIGTPVFYSTQNGKIVSQMIRLADQYAIENLGFCAVAYPTTMKGYFFSIIDMPISKLTDVPIIIRLVCGLQLHGCKIATKKIIRLVDSLKEKEIIWHGNDNSKLEEIMQKFATVAIDDKNTTQYDEYLKLIEMIEDDGVLV